MTAVPFLDKTVITLARFECLNEAHRHVVIPFTEPADEPVQRELLIHLRSYILQGVAPAFPALNHHTAMFHKHAWHSVHTLRLRARAL